MLSASRQCCEVLGDELRRGLSDPRGCYELTKRALRRRTDNRRSWSYAIDALVLSCRASTPHSDKRCFRNKAAVEHTLAYLAQELVCVVIGPLD